jgi:hypothetical protein
MAIPDRGFGGIRVPEHRLRESGVTPDVVKSSGPESCLNSGPESSLRTDQKMGPIR